ncbi:uncharacterized protein UTRI_05810 [Ustilago trichophora]|uniref:Uncharacterized protein n=1 Tax=Ustilago trichophora TaxID=86804 RepID=A0A5C3EKZ2_9BASI|nr:uncharacterized protein UTRI_05810 [Ustilago trichophora]
MGTNTSSPAAYVDQSTGMSGIARMGGAQPRNKTTTSNISDRIDPTSPAATKPQQSSTYRPSVDTLPPYQPPEPQQINNA